MSAPLSQSFRWYARPLALVVAVLLAGAVARACLGFRYWQARQAATLAQERGRQVLETLDRLRAVLADVEAQRRGYLLTLDPQYLKAYGVSDESVRRDAQALQALVADDPLQSHRAGHLALTVTAKLREIDEIVKTARTSGLATLAMIRSLDEIRSQIDQMVDHERFLRVDQERRVEALEQRKAWLIATAIVIVAILAGVALALARLEAIRRRKATEENVQLQSDIQARGRGAAAERGALSHPRAVLLRRVLGDRCATSLYSPGVRGEPCRRAGVGLRDRQDTLGSAVPRA